MSGLRERIRLRLEAQRPPSTTVSEAVEHLRRSWELRRPSSLEQFALIARELVSDRGWCVSVSWVDFRPLDDASPRAGWIATAYGWPDAIALERALLEEIAALRARAQKKPPQTARLKAIAKGATQ